MTDKLLREELQYLRKGQGLTLARLRRASLVLEALGAPENPSVAQARIKALLEEMGHDRRDVQALWQAFALTGPQGHNLTNRREAFASQVGVRSSDTVENWENHALDELQLRLSVAPVPEDLARHNAFLMRRLDMRQIIGQGLSKVSMTREVVALRDNLTRFRYGTDTEDIAHIDNVKGVAIAEHEVNRDGQVLHLEFHEPLNRGQSATFMIQETYRWDYEAEKETFVGQTFTVPTLLFRVRVTFQTKMPRRLWRYHNLHSPRERPGRPGPENTIPRPTGIKTVGADLRMLHSGLASGIAWQW